MIRLQRSELVNWCFEPSQPLGIISGLKETFVTKDRVKRTSKAEKRPEDKTEIDARTIKKLKKGVGKLGWFMSDINRNILIT